MSRRCLLLVLLATAGAQEPSSVSTLVQVIEEMAGGDPAVFDVRAQAAGAGR